MEHQEAYTKLSLGRSTEDLLAEEKYLRQKDSPFTAESSLAENEITTTAAGKRGKLTRYMNNVKNIILYALALWGVFTLFRQGFQMTIQQTIHQEHHHHHEAIIQKDEQVMPQAVTTFQAPGSCDCGTSIVEALSLGCKYDSLAVAWLPPHCRDDDLTAEFEAQGPNGTWNYWADNAHTHELSVEEVGALADDPSQPLFYMNYDWHIVHCIFYWIKQYRALTRTDGKIMEPRNQNEGHIRHCGTVLRNRDWGTAAWVVFNTDTGP